MGCCPLHLEVHLQGVPGRAVTPDVITIASLQVRKRAERARLVAHIAVADAVCYIFGYAGVILFCTVIVPALLKIDLRTEALKLEQALGMSRAKPGLASAWRKFELRAYRLPGASPWPA
jgi:hypothetical protein